MRSIRTGYCPPADMVFGRSTYGRPSHEANERSMDHGNRADFRGGSDRRARTVEELVVDPNHTKQPRRAEGVRAIPGLLLDVPWRRSRTARHHGPAGKV